MHHLSIASSINAGCGTVPITYKQKNVVLSKLHEPSYICIFYFQSKKEGHSKIITFSRGFAICHCTNTMVKVLNFNKIRKKVLTKNDDVTSFCCHICSHCFIIQLHVYKMVNFIIHLNENITSYTQT